MRKPTPWWSTFPATLIWGLLFFRFTILAVHTFIPFALPEIWRQTITMGAAARYWNRWTVEPPANQWLPAVLESGDSNGVMPMEFPILNFVVAPSFSFGVRRGPAIARLWLVLISLLLTIWNARLWRGRTYQGVELSKAMWLVPLISLGGDWVGKFMPDFVSMMLVLIAVAHSWERPRYFMSFLLCALGLLMKPTSIAIFPFFLLSPSPRKIFMKTLIWALPAIAIAFLYYTAGLEFIRRYQEIPDLYYLQRRPFFTALWEYFSNWKPVLRFIMGKFYFAGGLFLVLIGLAAASLRARANRFTPLWGFFFCK